MRQRRQTDNRERALVKPPQAVAHHLQARLQRPLGVTREAEVALHVSHARHPVGVDGTHASEHAREGDDEADEDRGGCDDEGPHGDVTGEGDLRE